MRYFTETTFVIDHLPSFEEISPCYFNYCNVLSTEIEEEGTYPEKSSYTWI